MAYLSTTDFAEDKDFIDKWLYTIRTGQMDLSWMKSATEKISPEEANPRRGLTYRDLNVGTYGYTDIPSEGHMPFYKRPWFWAIGVGLFFAILQWIFW